MAIPVRTSSKAFGLSALRKRQAEEVSDSEVQV